MIDLRPYQHDLIERARCAMARGSRRVLLTSPTGSGKTCMVAQMLSAAVARGKRAWFCVHRNELLDQSVRTFVEAADLRTGIIAAGYPATPQAPVQVCSVPSLTRRADKLQAPDLIVFDECFVAGTWIGEIPIEEIKAGCRVKTWNEREQSFDEQEVLAANKRPAPATLYRITAEGHVVVCTTNHPFLLAQGWCRARDIQGGDFIHGMRVVRATDKAEPESIAALQHMLSKANGRSESSRCSSAHASEQPDAMRQDENQDGGHAQEHRPSPYYSWWQRLRDAGASALTGVGAWLAHRNRGVSAERAQPGTCHELQARYWEPQANDWCGSRRRFARSPESAGAGPQERCLSTFSRVDRVEVLERGRDDRFEQVCRDGYVYNFETANTHTYIANELTVHNCHHQASKTWSDIAKRFPRAAHIGLTATPERLDGKGLAPYFDALIQGPTTADLIDAGYLSHYALYTPPVQIDTSGLRMKAGDFDRHEVDARMTASTVVGDAVSHYVQHCAGGRALVFAWNLAASRQLADDFSAHGVPAAHVDGETPRPERADAMKRFRDGQLRVLCNVDLFGEGLDVPAVDAIFLLRPTSSLGLYLQQVGRGLRPAPGKTLVKIFDHVNNWQRHGLPDDVREWKLEGREKRSRNSEAMGRRCDKCFGVSPIGSTACKYCGQPFPVQAREITQVDGSLMEMNPEELRALRANQRDFYQYCKTLEEWKALARKLGYHSGWAWHMMVRQYQQQRENPTLFSSDEAGA